MAACWLGFGCSSGGSAAGGDAGELSNAEVGQPDADGRGVGEVKDLGADRAPGWDSRGDARADGTADAAPDGTVDVPAPGVADAGAEFPDAAHDAAHDAQPDVADAGLLDLPDSGPEADAGSGNELADKWPLGTVTRVCGDGLLAEMDSPSGPFGILVVRGEHYEMGLQAGCLIGDRVGQFYDSFMSYFLAEVEGAAAEMGLDPDAVAVLLASMMENLWAHMAPYVPAEQLDEIAGFHDAVMGDPALAAFWPGSTPEQGLRALVLLSNLSDLDWSGSTEEVLEKLSSGMSAEAADYYEAIASAGKSGDAWDLCAAASAAGAVSPGRMAELFSRVLPFRTSCSFFAAWGERTQDQHLLGSRNLDWSTDTGISALKGISIYGPADGHAHATIGYLGFVGALAGMSERGVVVSEVGSESVMERLGGEPWTVKFREVLEQADDLDEGIALATGTHPDSVLRPPTIGYNWMIAYGDPPSGGFSGAAALETNAAFAGVHRQGFDCDPSSQLVHFDAAGAASAAWTDAAQPFLANLEAEAVEVDDQANPRFFAVDAEGEVALDGDGCPVAQDPSGAPFSTGRVLPCAVYRGDEAMMHGIRRWQKAANGPQSGDGLMCHAGSYRNRYLVMHDLVSAYETGEAYQHDGHVWAEAAGQKVAMGIDEAETVARAAALGSNVLSVAYDATGLTVRVSWETGSGDGWQAASEHDYVTIDLGQAFSLLAE